MRREGRVYLHCPEKWLHDGSIPSHYNRSFKTNQTLRMPFGCSKPHCFLCKSDNGITRAKKKNVQRQTIRSDIEEATQSADET
jgi:hypothetical protein